MLAEGMAALATMLDMLEGMVAQVQSRGYTEEQARALVIHMVTGFKAVVPE